MRRVWLPTLMALAFLTACSVARPPQPAGEPAADPTPAPDPPASAGADQQVVEGRTAAVGGDIVVLVGEEVRTYPLAPGAELVREGKPLPFTALRANLEVRLTIRQGKVVRLEDLTLFRGDLEPANPSAPPAGEVAAVAEGSFAGGGRNLVAEVLQGALQHPGQRTGLLTLRIREPGPEGTAVAELPIEGSKVKALAAVDFAGDGRPYIVVESISEAVSDHTARAQVFRLQGQQLKAAGLFSGWWGQTDLVQEQDRTLIRIWSFFEPKYSFEYVPSELTCKPCPKLRQIEWIGYQEGGLRSVRTEVSRKAYSVYGAQIAEPPVPAEVRQLHDAALRNLAEGRPAEAAALLRQTVEKVLDYTDAWNDLALALAQTGQWAESRTAAAQAVEVNPWHGYAQFNLGLALLELKQPKEAETPLLAATALQVDRWEPHYALGRSYEGQGRGREALEEYRKALKIKPDQAAVQAAVRRLGGP